MASQGDAGASCNLLAGLGKRKIGKEQGEYVRTILWQPIWGLL